MFQYRAEEGAVNPSSPRFIVMKEKLDGAIGFAVSLEEVGGFEPKPIWGLVAGCREHDETPCGIVGMGSEKGAGEELHIHEIVGIGARPTLEQLLIDLRQIWGDGGFG